MDYGNTAADIQKTLTRALAASQNMPTGEDRITLLFDHKTTRVDVHANDTLETLKSAVAAAREKYFDDCTRNFQMRKFNLEKWRAFRRDFCSPDQNNYDPKMIRFMGAWVRAFQDKFPGDRLCPIALDTQVTAKGSFIGPDQFVRACEIMEKYWYYQKPFKVWLDRNSKSTSRWDPVLRHPMAGRIIHNRLMTNHAPQV